MKDRILVTGGAGYIGSHTVKQLIADDFDVVVVDSLEAGHKEAVDNKATLEIANLADKKKIAEIFRKYKPVAVIDFAAYLAVGESMEKPEKYLKNNVLNFINLLDVMTEVGSKLLIKSSTAAVYGNPTRKSDIPWQETFTESYKPPKSALLQGCQEGKKIKGEEFFLKFIDRYENSISGRKELALDEEEKSKLRIPLSIYGLSKLLDEVLMKKYDKLSGVKSVALRYFNVCGADFDGEIGEAKPKPTTLMVLAIYQALGKIPELQIFGRDYSTSDGTGVRDYIHPSDLAVGHVCALKYLLASGKSEVFNLGTGKGSSVLEVMGAVEKVSGRKIKSADSPRRSGDPSESVADPTKAGETLGWGAKHTLQDMAATAWKWHNNMKYE